GGIARLASLAGQAKDCQSSPRYAARFFSRTRLRYGKLLAARKHHRDRIMRRPTRKSRGRASRGREGGWLVPGSDGIWSARAGEPFHSWRSPPFRHAGKAEFEDQVPRKLSPVCSSDNGRASKRLFRSDRSKPLHAPGRARPGSAANEF